MYNTWNSFAALACINAIPHIREGLDVTPHSIMYRERKSGRRDDRIEPLELTSWELLNGSNVNPTPFDARRSCIGCKSRRRRRKYPIHHNNSPAPWDVKIKSVSWNKFPGNGLRAWEIKIRPCCSRRTIKAFGGAAASRASAVIVATGQPPKSTVHID